MCLLLESIRYENGQFFNIELHQARMNRAVQSIFSTENTIDLLSEIRAPRRLQDGRFKCRILYDTQIREVGFSLYKRSRVKKITLVTDNDILYQHKFADRSCINRHCKNLAPNEEIIFIKKELLRDASYSNIALWNGMEWHTPTYPLLKGTKRAELIISGKIISKKIKATDIKNYNRISFINALNDLGERTIKL